jgi:hypothetical protein
MKTMQTTFDGLSFLNARPVAVGIASSRESSLGSVALRCVVSQQETLPPGYLVVAPDSNDIGWKPNISTARASFKRFFYRLGKNPIPGMGKGTCTFVT